MCVRFRGVRTLSERGGYDEGWRCELHEIVRGSFDFEFVVSYFVDEVFGGQANWRRGARNSSRGGGLFPLAEAIVA